MFNVEGFVNSKPAFTRVDRELVSPSSSNDQERLLTRDLLGPRVCGFRGRPRLPHKLQPPSGTTTHQPMAISPAPRCVMKGSGHLALRELCFFVAPRAKQPFCLLASTNPSTETGLHLELLKYWLGTHSLL